MHITFNSHAMAHDTPIEMNNYKHKTPGQLNEHARVAAGFWFIFNLAIIGWNDALTFKYFQCSRFYPIFF